MAEHIMDHIAKMLGKDPVEVRLSNMNATDRAALEPMVEDLKKSSDYAARKRDIGVFNRVRVKRILIMRCMSYSMESRLFPSDNQLSTLYR